MPLLRGFPPLRIRLPEAVGHFYLISATRVFVLSALGIFVPIYLFIRGGNVFLFFILRSLTMGMVSVPAYLAARKGLEYLGLASVVFSMVEAGFLGIGVSSEVLLGILDGLAAITYWLSQHATFGLYGERREVAGEVARLSVINTALSTSAPFLGALGLVYLGPHVTFILLSLVLLVPLVKLIRGEWNPTKIELPLSLSLKPHELLFFSVEGVFIGSAVYFLYIYLQSITENLIYTGSYISLSKLLASLAMIYIAKRVDEKHDFALASWGFAAIAYTLLGMYALPPAAGIFLLALALLSPAKDIPYLGWLYNTIGERPGVVFSREVALAVSKTLTVVCLMFLDDGLRAAMLLGSLVSLGLGFMIYILGQELKERMDGIG